MKKRLLSMILALSMMLTILPTNAITAFADTADIGGDCGATGHENAVHWEYNASTQTLTISGTGEMADYYYTSTGDLVTTTAPWKNYTQQIRKVIIKDGVSSIGSYAFYRFSNMTDVTIPEGITSIGHHAFGKCSSMTGVTIPESVTLIDVSAFYNCSSLVAVNIPVGVQKINDAAFTGTNLESVSILGKTYLGQFAFQYNSNLKYITLSPDVEIQIVPYGSTFHSCENVKYLNYLGTESEWDKNVAAEKISKAGLFKGGSWSLDIEYRFAHMVTFMDNGSPVGTPQKVMYNETATAPTLSKEGYTLSWYYYEDPTNHTSRKIFFNPIADGVTEDLTLYADWQKKPATLTTSTEKLTCTVGETTTVDFTIAANGDTGNAATASLTVSDTDAVDILKVNGQTTPDKGFTYSFKTPDGESKLYSMTGKTEVVFNKAGTYTLTAILAVKDSEPIVKTVEITVKEKPVEPEPETYTLKVVGGSFTTGGSEAQTNGTVPVNAEAKVALNPGAVPEGMVFDQWTIRGAEDLLGNPNVAYNTESFTIPANAVTKGTTVTVEAQYRDSTIEDDGPNILGTAAVIATGVIGGAALAYQGHMLGTEFALRSMLPEWAVIPENRAGLALLIWKDAEQPEPAENVLYADIDENDTDTQKAARWAIENNLMELLDEDNNPDHFDPLVPVTYLDSIHAWKKAQELKNH